MPNPLYVYKGGVGVGTVYMVFPNDKAYVNLDIHALLTNEINLRFAEPYELLKKKLSDFDQDAVRPIDIDMSRLEYLDFFAITKPSNEVSFDALADTIVIIGPNGEEKTVYDCGKGIRPVNDDIYNKLMEIFVFLN